MPTCPVCRQKNEDNVTKCVYCGTNLYDVMSTQEVARKDLPSELFRPFPSPAGPPQPIKEVVLHVPGHPTSITLDKKEMVTLGRRSSLGQVGIVDLTDYKAYLLGVSRSHATIEIGDTHCILRDLGSANGTSLNGHTLAAHTPHMLSDGDQIRLGKLHLVVQILFEKEVPKTVNS